MASAGLGSPNGPNSPNSSGTWLNLVGIYPCAIVKSVKLNWQAQSHTTISYLHCPLLPAPRNSAERLRAKR